MQSSETRQRTDGLYAVVLAAGASTRFGSVKQLVRIAGRPLLHTAVTRAAEVTGNALIVVLGSGAAQLAPLLKHSPGSVVVNQEWREGLASSIRAGVAQPIVSASEKVSICAPVSSAIAMPSRSVLTTCAGEISPW